jgi:hypothetical protein
LGLDPQAVSAAALRDDFAAVRAVIAGLPGEVLARLHAAGLEGFNGRRAAPGSLWYWWALRRAYQGWLDEQHPFMAQ